MGDINLPRRLVKYRTDMEPMRPPKAYRDTTADQIKVMVFSPGTSP